MVDNLQNVRAHETSIFPLTNSILHFALQNIWDCVQSFAENEAHYR